MHIQYHTYQFSQDKQLSVVICNLPVSIVEETILSALKELEYDVISVTRQHNYLNVLILIVTALFLQSSKHMISLIRLLHCTVLVEQSKYFIDIPQHTNCQCLFTHKQILPHTTKAC